jgi:lipopolysaccharide biosynthesis glycosyltransferase
MAIHVAFCVDRAMIKPAAAAALSLLRTAKAPVHVHACVGPDDEAAAAMHRLLSAAGATFDVNLDAPETAHGLPFISPYGTDSTAAYRRIFLDALYPQLERMIYLDADVMVRGDLGALWQTDLGGLPAGAVSDPWWAAKPERAALFPEGYFNSGVLLQDLVAWRRGGIAARIAEYVRAWKSGNRIGLSGDAADLTEIWGFQTEMNAALSRLWRALPPRWNASLFHAERQLDDEAARSAQLQQARDDPAVLHFMGHEKPWEEAFARLTARHAEYQDYKAQVDALLPAFSWPAPYGARSEKRRTRRIVAMKLIAQAKAVGVRRAALLGPPLIVADAMALARDAGIAVDCVVNSAAERFIAVGGVDIVSIEDALLRGCHTFLLGFDDGVAGWARRIVEAAVAHGTLPAIVTPEGDSPSRPAKLRLEATSHCQLRCPACPTASGAIDAALGRGTLDPEAFEKLLAHNPHIRSVELSNYGEAMLHPKMVHLLEIAQARDVGITLENGVNFNNVRTEALEAMVRTGVKSVRLSIDGASRETYARYRKDGDFAAVMGNLLKLVAFKRKARSDLPRLTWQFIVFEHNRHEIEKARGMAQALGMRFVTKLAWGADSVPAGESRAAHLEQSGEIYLHQICEQLWRDPQVNWNGDVLGCCRNFWGRFGGNAMADGLPAALNGEGLRRARRVLMGLEPARPENPCSTCEIYHWRRDNGRWIDAAAIRNS